MAHHSSGDPAWAHARVGASSASVASAPARSDDPAWAHARAVPNAKNNTICLHCNKLIKGGGITRLKYHLAGIRGQVEPCKKASSDIRFQMKQMIEDLKKSKQTKKRIQLEIGNPYDIDEEDDEEEEDDEVRIVEKSPPQTLGKRKSRGKDVDNDVSQIRGKKKIKSYFAPRTTPGAQPSIRSALATKAMIDNAKMSVARWWYHSNVPFYASQSPYYQPMIDSVAAIGPGFKGPSFYELRGPLLKNAVHEVNDFLLDIKNDWKVYGCSLMSDGWTNQKQQPIMNFLVYCPRGAMFLKSIDTSGLTKDADTLFNIFDSVVQEIAHCIDLMLENIANPRWFPLIDEAIKKAKKITKFIYNHGVVLDMMRQDFTNGRVMSSCNYKTAVGKEISKIVLEDYAFWSQCKHIVKVSEPLVRVLRLVDGDEKPAMGVIDTRWDKQLHSPLHAAGCFLNPAIYFRPSFKRQNEVQRGLLSTLMRLVPDPDIQDKISSQLDEYKKSIGDFGTSLAIRQRERLNPVSWWEQFGLGAPDLQSFAIRVLSQCCSATGCERNWSTFEYVHSKKRNRLEHKRVNDLVFVHYNLRLRERNIQRNKYAMDPISLDNIDLMGDWVAEEPTLLNPDDINWDCLNEVNVEEDAEFETIDVDDDDDDDNNNEHVLTNLPMGASSSCGSSFDDEFDPFFMDDEEEE
uniref:BED-type domain-containing protein n=1 Tax=Quercus lobata TaxID=97700 RepID=A0A7N2MM08_QUELO